MISFVMLSVIAQDIIETHAGDIGHILDVCPLLRIVFDPVHKGLEHAFVTLKDPAHIVLEAVIVIRKIPGSHMSVGSVSVVSAVRILPAVGPDFEPAEIRVPCNDAVGGGADHMDAVHVVADAPVPHDCGDIVR